MNHRAKMLVIYFNIVNSNIFKCNLLYFFCRVEWNKSFRKSHKKLSVNLNRSLQWCKLITLAWNCVRMYIKNKCRYLSRCVWLKCLGSIWCALFLRSFTDSNWWLPAEIGDKVYIKADGILLRLSEVGYLTLQHTAQNRCTPSYGLLFLFPTGHCEQENNDGWIKQTVKWWKEDIWSLAGNFIVRSSMLLQFSCVI